MTHNESSALRCVAPRRLSVAEAAVRSGRTFAVFGFALGAAILAGCSSPSTHYYTLSVPASQQSVSQQGESERVRPAVHYRIDALTIPAQVDDTPLVVRHSSDQLMVLTYDRWTAPLTDQIKDALAQALTREIGMPPLQNLGSGSAFSTAQKGVSQISVDVQRFDLLPGQAALMDVVWQIKVPAQGRRAPQTWTCYSELSTPSAVGVAPLVAAQQNNVVMLAAQIAQVLESRQDSTRAESQMFSGNDRPSRSTTVSTARSNASSGSLRCF